MIFSEDSTDNVNRKTILWLYYSNTDITLTEEVLLFDFAAILSAVGGSLGLFIGFSFLDILKATIKKFFG